MTEDEKQKIIAHLIDNVFVPQLIGELHVFVREYQQNYANAQQFIVLTGLPVGVPLPPLDIRQSSQNLFNNIVNLSKQWQ